MKLDGVAAPCVGLIWWLVSVHLEEGFELVGAEGLVFPKVPIQNLRQRVEDADADRVDKIVWFDLTAAIESIRTGAHPLPYEGFVLGPGRGMTWNMSEMPEQPQSCVSEITDAKLEVTIAHGPLEGVPDPVTAVREPSVPRVAVPVPDLVVVKDRVTVKGKEGARGDCDPGPNDISVPVKNEGSGAAGPFTVQLQLDNEPHTERTAEGLEPARERVVVFQGVEIAPGGHKIKLIAKLSGQTAQDLDKDDIVEIALRCQQETHQIPGRP